MEVPSAIEMKATILFAAETKAMVLVDEKRKMKTKNSVHHPEKVSSSSFSVVSSTDHDDDDDHSSSSSIGVLLPCSLASTECSVSLSSSSDFGKISLRRGDENDDSDYSSPPPSSFPSFTSLRLNYLLVTLVIMLADGLQGTHLYVLYEGYGYNVASLYALGFIAGAVTTPITGPLIDRFGRKRSAILYCGLEMGINVLEQYPLLAGLLVSRMVGGITTNLLSSVFETWLDTEFRNRRRAAGYGIDAATVTSDDATSTTSDTTNEWNKAEDDGDRIAKNEYELIMRDSVVVSNLASIASGYLAHILAERYGPVGPFQGAVSCTGIALIAICLLWKENYGVSLPLSRSEEETETETVAGNEQDSDGDADHRIQSHEQNHPTSTKSVREYITEAIAIFRSDPRILCLGIIQGLSAGSLQLFVFLWSPTLRSFSACDDTTSVVTANGCAERRLSLSPLFRWAVDRSGEPTYGLIFGAFMAAGVSGGLCAPYIRRAVGLLFRRRSDESSSPLLQTVRIDAEGIIGVRSMELEFLLGVTYLFAAALMIVPSVLPTSSPESFSIALAAFLAYEFLAGITMTCEGVVRSLHLPSDGRATMMMVPRMIVNLVVSLGVLLTKYIATQSAFVAVAFLMACSGFLQLSFISPREWTMIHRKSIHHARRLASSAANLVTKPKED